MTVTRRKLKDLCVFQGRRRLRRSFFLLGFHWGERMENEQTARLSPKRRVLSALFGGRKGDRPPVGNPTSIVCQELMEKTGIYFPQAHLDPKLMAELAAAGHEILGFDTIMPEYSVQQEAAALGMRDGLGQPFHDARRQDPSLSAGRRYRASRRIFWKSPPFEGRSRSSLPSAPPIRGRRRHRRQSHGPLDDLLSHGRDAEFSALGLDRTRQGPPAFWKN